MYKESKSLECIKELLLQNVMFCIETKTVRKGKLLLFNQDDYYIKFLIQTNKNINKNYEIPYPYNVSASKHGVALSYTLEDLSRGNLDKLQYMQIHTPTSGTNKLHNKVLTISVFDC